MLRWLTAGESHGPALTAIVEGMPAGVPIDTPMVANDLARRRLGFGRGARMKFEADVVEITGGVRHGSTLGGPIAIQIANSEWPKWNKVMAPDPLVDEELETTGRGAPLTRPRPGHADLAGMQKYDFVDARPILERASARETAARVALGVVAKSFLRAVLGSEVISHVVRIGSVDLPEGILPSPADLPKIDADPVRCADKETSELMQQEVSSAHKDGDTLGGVVEVLVTCLPPGLGSHVHWDRRLDARLASALMGIQAVKVVEVGDGLGVTALRGSQAHDEIHSEAGRLKRKSGHSGGTEGGMTTGELLRVRAGMKPISTVPRALETVDVATGESAKAIAQRSDVCAVPALGVVAEAMVALVVADAVLEKFGGDSVGETRRNVESYLAALRFR